MSNDLSIMIVDDEILVANLLKNSVEWGNMSMKVDAVAASASEALDILDQKAVDIIFTDIHMPFMDGLTFSKKALSLYPQIKIIVLTGYNEFAYAKESVSIGVVEYLQKPINIEEVTGAALRAKEQIFAEREIINNYNRLQTQINDNIEFLRDKFFLSLALGNVKCDKIENALKSYHIDSSENYIQFAVLDIIPDESYEENTRYFLNNSALKLIKMTYEHENTLYIFEDAYQRIVMLSMSRDIDLFNYLSQITSYLLDQIPCKTNVGIGGIYGIDESSKKSYDEACAALKFAQSNSENEIADVSDVIIENEIANQYNLDGIEDVAFFVRIGVANKAIDALNRIFSKLIVDSCTMNTTKIVAAGIISGITQSIILSSISGLEAFQVQTNIMKKIYSVDNLEEVIEIISDYIIEMTKKIEKLHKHKQNSSVNAAKEYIEDNIANPNLSLTLVAEVLGYNKCYLSRLFKQETKKTFSDYIMATRMSKAMSMLVNQELRSYQVAEAIGYIDPNYFSVCFKKYTGMTVSEYRSSKDKSNKK